MCVPYELFSHFFHENHLFFELISHISKHIVQVGEYIAHVLACLTVL